MSCYTAIPPCDSSEKSLMREKFRRDLRPARDHKKLREITRECSKATRSMQNTRFISHAKTGKKMRARKSPPVTMPRKENQIMMKQLTENGWGDDPWLLRGGDKGAFANAALMVLAGALPPLSNRKGYTLSIISISSQLIRLLIHLSLFYSYLCFMSGPL